MALVRTLPLESSPYVKADRGCRRNGERISWRCVDCHLPGCLEEMPGGIAALRMERTQMLILGLHERGASVETMANTLRVTKRIVYRVLEEA